MARSDRDQKPHRRFSDLLSIGIHSVAARQGLRRVETVEQELAEKLGYSSFESVRRWRKGYTLPKDQNQIEFLVRYCATYGYVSRDWARDFLAHANLLNGREALLDELFPRTSTPNYYAARALPKLPRVPAGFRGRDAEMAYLLKQLSPDNSAGVVVIYGMGGIGKTALAIACSYACLGHQARRSGAVPPSVSSSAMIASAAGAYATVVFISTQDGKLSLHRALDEIGRVLGCPEAFIREYAIHKKVIPIQNLLSKSPVLLVIDDFDALHDPDLTQFLLEGVPNPSKVLITTRDYAPVLWTKTSALQLKGLPEEEALRLVRERATEQRLKLVTIASDDELVPLVRVTAGNPHALLTALGLIAFQQQPLDAVVRDLERGQGQLFDYIFKRVWPLLDDVEQRVLMALSFFSTWTSQDAITATAGLNDAATSRALGHLCELSLTSVHDQGSQPRLSYSLHSLTRAFVRAQLTRAPEFEAQARRRWVEHYLSWAARVFITDAPQERYWNTQITAECLEHVDAEWPNIRQALSYAHRSGLHSALIELMKWFVRYMDRRALLDDRITFARAAAAAARALGQLADEALFRIDALGWTLMEQRDFAMAKAEIMAGLNVARALDPGPTEALDLLALGYAFLARAALEMDESSEAERWIRQAQAIRCGPAADARVRLIAGEWAYRQGRYHEAVQIYREALHYSQQYNHLGDYDWRYRLGFAYIATGDIAQAEATFQAMQRNDPAGLTVESAYARFGMARVHHARGDLLRAAELAQEAECQIRSLGAPQRLAHDLRDFMALLEAG